MAEMIAYLLQAQPRRNEMAGASMATAVRAVAWHPNG